MSNFDNTSLPFATVIVPCFNVENVVIALLNSLAQQSFDLNLFEVICVDNGSTDSTRRVINNYARSLSINVRCVEEGQKVGSYAARNKGVSVSRGDVLFFTDADCCVDSDWLKNGVTTLMNNGKSVVCGGAIDLTAEIDGSPNPVEMFEIILGFTQQRNVEEVGYSVTANLMCWRSLMLAVGPFDSRLLSKGDFEWCARARKAGYRLIYADSVRVVHPARRSLRSIMIKTRRVTGGQAAIRETQAGAHLSNSSTRTFGRQLELIFGNSQFPGVMRKGSVLAVGVLLYLTKLVERCRLKLGYDRERR